MKSQRSPEPPPDEPELGDDGRPTFFTSLHWDYGTYAKPGEESKRRAFFAWRDALNVVARMLARHHGFTPAQAHGIVWGRKGVLQSLYTRKGRPPKPHLIADADYADEVLSRGKDVHWDAVHFLFVGQNHPDERRPIPLSSDTEPRDSENWQRAVRRIRANLRAEATALAKKHGGACAADGLGCVDPSCSPPRP
jgi:hypothetical protein